MTSLIEEIRGKKLLLAASTGGHLAQLDYLARLIQPHPESLWVTFDKPQSRSLQDGRRIDFVDYIAPRDIRGVLGGRRRFKQILQAEEFDAVLSTGSAIALSALPAGIAARRKTIYIESVSRYDGPSVSGRIVSFLPGIILRTQHPEWASEKWPYEFSVMDSWDSLKTHTARPVGKIFVTLGTIQPYRFDALIDSILRALPPGVEIAWQLGATTRTDLPGEVHNEIASGQFDQLALQSDVVISHAGVGSLMNLLNLGCHVVAVPRRKSRHEHVDDHQLQVARDLGARELCVVAEADALTFDDIERSMTLTAGPARSMP